MELLGELWRRLLYGFRRRQFNRDLEEEMRFHLEMKTQETGEAAARRKFGNAALLLEDSRRAWGWTAIESWAADLKYALRALRLNPGFAAVAVITLALGIGASTAVFSVVNGVLLRPLPFHEPGRVMMIWETREKRGEDRVVVSYQNYVAWKAQSQSFEDMGVFAWDGGHTMQGDEPVPLISVRVSRSFFPALGVQPILGRNFVAEEERMSAPRVTVLSYGLWQRLGGNRALVGNKVTLDRQAYTVVGIMPRGFTFPDDSELWFPFATDDSRSRPGTHYLRVVGRLRPGVTVQQAQTEMQNIAVQLRSGRPAYDQDIGANVVPVHDQVVGDYRRALVVLMGAVGCVLLIACANVASLLLVRVTSRRRELALRLALGAGRWRAARCLLAESVTLALAGGVLGIGAAYWLVRGFVALDPIHLPRVREVAMNWQVLVTSVTAAVVIGVLFGLAPALRASQPGMANWLKEGPGSSEVAKNRGRHLLAALQMALAVTLLIGAGLLLRSFVMRVSVPLGFRPEGALGVELPWYSHTRIDQLLDRLHSLPGVQAAGAATAFPQNRAGSWSDQSMEIEGRPKTERGKSRETGYMVATVDFFRAAGMTLRAGRFFTFADGADAPKVAVINESLARRDFANQDPIGAHVRWSKGDWSTIVGVAGNVKGFGVAGDPMPAIYFPNKQGDWGNPVQVVVRTAVPPASLAATVRKEIRTWDKRMVLGKVETMDDMLARSVAAPRFYMLLVAGFAALALVVSAVGVYGTVNYSVARQTHEIGIRMALGAERSKVLTMIFGQGLRLLAVGVVLGVAGAWISTRVLETLLFGIRPTDAAAFACGSGVLVFAVLLACYIPARRATRVDPLVALRHE